MTTPVELDALADRLATLVERLEANDMGDDLRIALEGLRASLEKLRSTDEELSQQKTEELADLHTLVEAERQRYQDLFASAPVPYLVTELTGTILEANAASAELFAIPRRFLEGKPISAFVAVEQRRTFRRLVLGLGAEPVEEEFRFKRRSGVLFDAKVAIAPVVDTTSGVIESLRWAIRDVTDERQAEGQLWELSADLESRVSERTAELNAAYAVLTAQRAQFEAIVQSLPAAVLVADAEGRVLVSNVRADELFGQRVERLDAVANRFQDSEGRPGALPLAEDGGGDGARESLTFERTNGERVLLEVTVALVASASASASASVVYVFHDVTVQRRRDIAQREFVVNAAHELRTPLAAIVSAIEVLQAGGKNDPATRDVFLGHLERESERLVRLARSLLLLSRAQADEERPPRELVPLRQMLGQVADAVRPAPAVTVQVHCDEELAALVNEDLLRQALSSLADNAARYTESGTITLRAHACDERRVAVEVVDTGPGLTEEERMLVTHRFVRGARSRDGFGLGLAIASEAARAAGGQLELESEQGVGTTARIVVQLAQLVTV